MAHPPWGRVCLGSLAGAALGAASEGRGPDASHLCTIYAAMGRTQLGTGGLVRHPGNRRGSLSGCLAGGT